MSGGLYGVIGRTNRRTLNHMLGILYRLAGNLTGSRQLRRWTLMLNVRCLYSNAGTERVSAVLSIRFYFGLYGNQRFAFSRMIISLSWKSLCALPFRS